MHERKQQQSGSSRQCYVAFKREHNDLADCRESQYGRDTCVRREQEDESRLQMREESSAQKHEVLRKILKRLKVFGGHRHLGALRHQHLRLANEVCARIISSLWCKECYLHSHLQRLPSNGWSRRGKFDLLRQSHPGDLDATDRHELYEQPVGQASRLQDWCWISWVVDRQER